MQIKIDISQTEIDAVYANVANKVQQVASNTTQAIGELVVQQARSTDKFHHGTQFEQGIQFTKISATEGQVTSEVINSKGVEYSQYLQFGNGPVGGFIQPRYHNYLHFYSNSYGWVKTKQVRTIASDKRGFITDAMTVGQQQAESIFNTEWNKVFGNQ